MRALLILTTMLLAAFGPGLAAADPTNITITGGASPVSQTLPTGSGAISLSVPLQPNAINQLNVTAKGSAGQTVSQQVNITQITLSDIVLASVQTTLLTPTQVQNLVANGTINLSDPANYTVSEFDIVLTIKGQPVPVSIPVATPINQPNAPPPQVTLSCGSSSGAASSSPNTVIIPCGGGGGGGGQPPDDPIILVPVTVSLPPVAGLPPIPGVILIQGKIKTLKEFFDVKLMLSNISTLFDLSGLTATLTAPTGLTLVTPASGPLPIADLAPGVTNSGDFIVRGDAIGNYDVTVNFGGMLSGPILPTAIPFTGSATASLQVKGPPQMAVTVNQPEYVNAGVPYTLTVTIKDTDPVLPALYASLSLDVGVDAQILDPTSGLPLTAPSVTSLGNILPGQSTTLSYEINPLVSGPVNSCTAATSQNLALTVNFTGGSGPGCAIGTLPSVSGGLTGVPTVTVVPAPNTSGVSVNGVVVAIFSQIMLNNTITAGYSGASFQFTDSAGNFVPATLSFGTLSAGNTVAILTPNAPLAPSTKYLVTVLPTIFNQNGIQLGSGEALNFTTGPPQPPVGTAPPTATLTADPPISATAVAQGQIVPLTVKTVDAAPVTEIDLFLDGNFIQTSTVTPAHFTLSTAALAPLSTHTLTARVIDAAGNTGSTTLGITIAPDTIPPVVSFQNNASATQGSMLPVTVVATDNIQITSVKVFLDGATTPYFTGVYAPYMFGLDTSSLKPGQHNLSAVAIDGAGNTAQASTPILVLPSAVPPSIVITAPASGSAFVTGSIVTVAATATDVVGIAQVQFFVDGSTTPVSTGNTGFNLNTAGFSTGNHTVKAVATDNSGNVTSTSVTFALSTTPSSTPPAAPLAALIASSIPAGGLVTVTGQPGSVAAGTQLLLTNTSTQASATTIAGADGSFSAQLEASGGNQLAVFAIGPGNVRSAAATLAVPAAPTLISLGVSPTTISLNKTLTAQQLTVTGGYSDGSTQNLTGTVSYSSGSPGIATVSSTGLVLEAANGATSIVVSATGVSAVSVPVTVTLPVITSVTVSPSTVAIKSIGFHQQLTVTANYSDGTTQPFPGVLKFASNSPTVASVTTGGLVTGVANGATSIAVVAGSFAPIAVPVTVTGGVTLVSISASPNPITLIGQGQSQALTVTGSYSDGSTAVLSTGVTFTSGNSAVAPVSSSGVVSAVSNGSTSISVATNSVSPVSVPVTVKSLTGIALSPASVTLVGANKTATLSVIGTYSDGSTATLSSGVVFSSTNPSVVSVSASGVLTSLGAGTVKITAGVSGFAATATVSVAARIATGLVVSPPSLSLNGAGSQTPLTASLSYNDGTTAVATTGVTYLSANAAIAAVSSAGVVTAESAGATSVSVTLGSFSASVPVAVTIPTSTPGPQISSIDRGIAGEGDAFVIHGANFAALPSGNTVLVNGLAATVLSARSTQITAVVPRDASATTSGGNVTVTVGGQQSNVAGLNFYGRLAAAQTLTGGVAIPATTANLTLSLSGVDFHTGDLAYLSSARDILAPVSFGGVLSLQVDGGASIPVLSGTTPSLTSAFVDGIHTVTATLGASQGIFQTGPLYLIVGPKNTGAIAGNRNVIAIGLSLPTPVTFTNLTDNNGNALANGTQVGVSVLNGQFVTPNNCCYIGSAGGTIDNGSAGNDPRARFFTVNNGRIDVLYDPIGANAIGQNQQETAVVQVIPADGSGNLTSNRSIATTNVTLNEIQSAAAPTTVDDLLALGTPATATASLLSLRDTAGLPVPDGATIAISALGGNFVSSNGCCYIGSSGGAIDNGASGSDARVKYFTLTKGRVDATYDTTTLEFPQGQSGTAVIDAIPSAPNGTLYGNQVFATPSFALVPLSAQGGNFTVTPPSVLAINQDYRVIATLTNIVDANGNPIPDGTLVAVSVVGGQFVTPNGCCYISSAGGTIINGNPSPDSRVRVFTVEGGAIEVVYSALGVALTAETNAQATIQVLPSDPNGNPIGNRTFVTTTVNLTSLSGASASVNPALVVADGLSEPVTVVFSGIVDTAGNPVPDGTPVLASTSNGQFVTPNNCCYISSAGGSLTNGVAVADPRVQLYTVTGGSVTITYDPISVPPLGSAGTATATLQLLPAAPDGSLLGNRTFATTTVQLSAPVASTTTFVVAPTSVLANNQDDRVTATLSNITDASGNLVPNGTLVAVSVSNGQWVTPNGCCYINSAGGQIVNGTASSDPRYRLFTVNNGQIQIVYSSLGVTVGAEGTNTTVLQVLPATPAGVVIGNRTFVTANITLTSGASATITGPGTLGTGASASYVINGITDSAGNPLPNGTVIGVSAANGQFVTPNGCCFIGDAGGTVTNGTAGVDPRVSLFTIQGGSVTVNFTAPASAGTADLQLLPVDAAGNVIGNRTYAVQSISVGP